MGSWDRRELLSRLRWGEAFFPLARTRSVSRLRCIRCCVSVKWNMRARPVFFSLHNSWMLGGVSWNHEGIFFGGLSDYCEWVFEFDFSMMAEFFEFFSSLFRSWGFPSFWGVFFLSFNDDTKFWLRWGILHDSPTSLRVIPRYFSYRQYPTEFDRHLEDNGPTFFEFPSYCVANSSRFKAEFSNSDSEYSAMLIFER